MRPRSLAAVSLVAILAWAAPSDAGDVTGRITLDVRGANLADLGPTVVFLESDSVHHPVVRPARHPMIRQRDARFDPDFLVITAGQGVEMPNDDTIFHNVFSFSRPNDFDLGTYPSGESRTVTFPHPGLVKIYCSIHESMAGAILVTPSPWYATATPSGSYRIADVPVGAYRLTVWNEMLPPVTRALRVGAEESAQADVDLGIPVD